MSVTTKNDNPDSLKKVLIFGATTQSAIYVAKQFKQYGIHVSIIDWYRIPVNKSRYIDRYYYLGSPEEDLELFISEVVKFLQKEKFSAMLPIHDPAVEICRRFRQEFSKYVNIIGLNPDEIQEYACNKWKLFEAAKSIGINVPGSILIESIKDIERVIPEVTFPCVAKPASSAQIANNSIVECKVLIAQSKEELIDYIREYINTVKIIIQEYIEGFGIGYNIIAEEGKVLNAYIHKRIQEKTGVSVYRETIPLETFNLTKQVNELVEKMHWSGVAMIEFRISDGVPFLMEMNGRFWGSIELGIRSGLNYPVQLFEMQVLHKKIPENIPYKLVRVRNLREEINYNIGLLLYNKDIKEFGKWLLSLKNMFRSDEFIEDNIFDDTAYVLSFYKRDLRRVLKKILKKIVSLFSSPERRTIENLERKNLNIIFVCKGNICRSPFAEKYARQNFPENIYSSMGTVHIEKRYPPMNAVQAAMEYGIDLENFLSSRLRKKEIEKADIFFVMDKINYDEIISLGIEKQKIFFLNSTDIPDPYKKNIEYYRAVYKQIAESLNRILNHEKNSEKNLRSHSS